MRDLYLLCEFSVTARKGNVGLASQWYSAWRPTVVEEVAFIFEDDMEVSPFYFQWAQRAVVQYYANNSEQVDLHWQLLTAVRKHIRANGSAVLIEGVVYDSHLDYFVHNNSGKPLIYGVCLQKQHLDVYRYPKKLHIRNNHQPFLYR
jgi:hypothetical protein